MLFEQALFKKCENTKKKVRIRKIRLLPLSTRIRSIFDYDHMQLAIESRSQL
jgi:hypothetical protein